MAIPEDTNANAGVFRIDCERDSFDDLMTLNDVDEKGQVLSFRFSLHPCDLKEWPVGSV